MKIKRDRRKDQRSHGSLPAAIVALTLLATQACSSNEGAPSNEDEVAGAGGSAGQSGAMNEGGNTDKGGHAGVQPESIDAATPRQDAGSVTPDAARPPWTGTCPTTVPFDDQIVEVKANCTRRVLVAVGNGLRRIVSLDDGATWLNEHSMPFPNGGDENENSFTGVAVGRGLIITTGDAGVHISRDRGNTWTLVPQFGKRQHASAMAYGDGRFLLTRWTGGGAFSANGETWTEVTIPGNGHSHGAAYGNGKWASIYNGTSVSFSADNGKTWQIKSFATFSGGWLEAIVFGAGKFVIVGQPDGRRAMTVDGTVWQGVANNQTPSAAKIQFEDVTWDGKEFLSAGSSAFSADGIEWKSTAPRSAVDSIQYDEGLYFGARGNALFTSKDGRSWAQVWKGGITAPFTKLAIGYVLK